MNILFTCIIFSENSISMFNKTAKAKSVAVPETIY
ncbi:MAG: hypothetical protein JWR61_136 [Ferruginibacter sp.]|nr:hypothetical protein [Ferruginibacter sp.]